MAAETVLDRAIARAASYNVTVVLFSCQSLPNADGATGASDPYVRFTLGDETRK